MGPLLLVVALTILISAQCSFFESVLYSCRMGHLEALRSDKRKGPLAGRLIEMKRSIAAPIAAILILNTIANTAGATLAGMYAHEALGARFVPIFSIVFTLAILFLAEIGPKTVGAVHWKSTWTWVVWPLVVMRWCLSPAIRVSEAFANRLTGGQSTPAVSEEEIVGAIRMGADEGEISHWESDVVQNLIGLEDVRAKDVMTPRITLFALSVETTPEEAKHLVAEREFSRIPVFGDDKDHLIGYITKQELLAVPDDVKTKQGLKSILRELPAVTEKENCLKLLMRFLRERWHIAAVTDSFGGTAGVLTLEDLVETLLGAEIVDESDQIEDLRSLAHNKEDRG